MMTMMLMILDWTMPLLPPRRLLIKLKKLLQLCSSLHWMQSSSNRSSSRSSNRSSNRSSSSSHSSNSSWTAQQLMKYAALQQQQR
jgi:hypothetical protein